MNDYFNARRLQTNQAFIDNKTNKTSEIRRMIYLAYEDGQMIGAYTSKAMAEKWANGSDKRELAEVVIIDKTFARMSVDYNRSYEG